MKLITRDTDYAIRALCIIAKKNDLVSVNEVCKETGVPKPFLRKILQVLNKKGILHSYKGQFGGFKLSKPKEKIRLLEIMEIFQGSTDINNCFLKKVICPNLKICPLRKRIEKIRNYIHDEFEDVTIAALLRS